MAKTQMPLGMQHHRYPQMVSGCMVRTFSAQGGKGQSLMDEEGDDMPEVAVRDKKCYVHVG